MYNTITCRFPAKPPAFLPSLFFFNPSSSSAVPSSFLFQVVFINSHFFFLFQFTFFLPYKIKKHYVKTELLYLPLHVCVVHLGHGLSTAFYYSFMPLGYPSKKLPEQSWCPKAILGKFACLFVCSFSCIFIWHGLAPYSAHFFGYDWGV